MAIKISVFFVPPLWPLCCQTPLEFPFRIQIDFMINDEISSIDWLVVSKVLRPSLRSISTASCTSRRQVLREA